MMCDIERIEVFMHDVRMQLVNAFRWVCLGGVFFCSHDWRFPVADGCAGLQLFSFLSG